MVFDNRMTISKQQQDGWIRHNTAYCLRMQAFMSVDGCLENQQQSQRDLRCSGCNDLFNQPAPGQAKEICQEAIKQSEDEFQTNGENLTDEEFPADCSDLPLPEDFEEVVRDWDFQDLNDKPYENITLPREEPPEPILNFRGRCPVCQGYMQPVLETGDHNVFRCINCSWRTSPEYQRNRMYHARIMGL